MRNGIGRRAAAALLGAALALAGCAAGGTGSGPGSAGPSVMDLTWGWGWEATGTSGPYQDLTPAEREARLESVKPVDQVEFLSGAKSNGPTGAAAVPATFVDTQGRTVSLSDYRGRYVVLVFTRGFSGYICPLCTSYTAQIAYRYKEIAAAGAEVLVVFPGSPEKVADFVRAAREILSQEGAGALPFPVLLDANLGNVKAFGIQGDLARPSTYVLGPEGTILYSFVGDQPHERPDVATILSVLRRAGTGAKE